MIIRSFHRNNPDNFFTPPIPISDLAIEAASYFDLKKDAAAKEAKHILSVVGHSWRSIAESYGISKYSQEAMKPAFSICSEK